ncbi:MAG: phosphoribosylformylglycinamidine synthase subunit PurQ [Proteobacteria bacterium]|nr:phosphoribosylformylglycinamidine synthase subunit PurQ [Pseudomonadota bacterium]
MKSAVIVFPGSNCDRDAKVVLEATGLNPVMVWHGDSAMPKVDVVVLPGGFSYGDYLRSGAMAAHSPIMQEVKKHAEKGGKVIGICNGFQVLTESGLLPGILMRNAHLKFVCKDVLLRVETTNTAFTKNYRKGQVVNIPVAHHDGNYFADEVTLARLKDKDQIVFRYCDADGKATEAANPNGSPHNIAGICNEKRNVLGMMPHPERHAEALLGGLDGKALFESLLAA